MPQPWSIILLLLAALGGIAEVSAADKGRPQYQHEGIVIARPSADELKRSEVSAALADEYLRRGALAWRGSKECISCHTTGLYLTTRPALAPYLGQPMREIRDFFVEELRAFEEMEEEEIQKGTKPAQVIYLAAGLAEWDAHVAKTLSKETREALTLMFSLQQTNGSWGSLDCWPPYESDAFHLATMAAMAAGTAPGWLGEKLTDADAKGLASLKQYLRNTPPPHDYGRTLLLWASTRLRDLITDTQRQQTIALIKRHQRPDGGWSMRTFAAPEAWGGGSRADKLRGEKEFANPPSDGHQTGLAVIVLREAGVASSDEHVRRGISWLKANQRESGRWWTRSLNNDAFHYITYSGTAFPLLALAKCGELPRSAE